MFHVCDITFTDFVFEIEGLRVMSNCSILFVRQLISSPFKLFKSLIVSFPTSVGLKIGQFLPKFLLRN